MSEVVNDEVNDLSEPSDLPNASNNENFYIDEELIPPLDIYDPRIGIIWITKQETF